MFHIVLVEPEIPPNTGNIARLCAATGSTLHLIEPLGFSLDEKQLKRAGMDYWHLVNWRTWPDWPAFAASVTDSGARLWLLTTKTNRPYTTAEFHDGDYLVFGRETKGLPESLLAADHDRCLTIPMPNPAARSLNLATSAGIVLYEALRQTNSPSRKGNRAFSTHEI
ncbi:MAG: tRNA (cytidine(34)-2'-O)-methyltransferase [Verrucomicrobiales bacterium]|jgi:tRNA (cytidine/uridine-2'-O-)-methyltransferase|nr:tRNA (cytidine(34)-2'-O)-methyltransferase [Verrucomicrobiales bacterium]